MVSLLVLSFVAAMAAPPQPSSAAMVVPPAGVTQELVLQDGTRALGRVEEITGNLVIFRTASDEVIRVERSQIAEIAVVTDRVESDNHWPADSHATRMMFTPTARSLERGESYFGVAGFAVPFVQIGITDRISIGGGTPPFVTGGAAHPFWLTPKVQVFAGQKTQAAIGMVHVTSLGNGGLGIAYGVVTRGSADAAVTVGLGYAYIRGFDTEGGAPVVMAAAERRVGRKVKLLTENVVFRGGGMLSGSVRLFGKRRAVDLGLMMPLAGGRLFAFPAVNFVRKF